MTGYRNAVKAKLAEERQQNILDQFVFGRSDKVR